jgi:hypothetical protein
VPLDKYSKRDDQHLLLNPGRKGSRCCLGRAADFAPPSDPEATPAWTDLVVRLSPAPFISIAATRGRTRGGGDELALACDLRYASREHAVFGQPEVGSGILPGGGGAERLPRLIGRNRGGFPLVRTLPDGLDHLPGVSRSRHRRPAPHRRLWFGRP